MIRKSGYLVLLAVTLVLIGTVLTSESVAEFEQSAMTCLFVLAAFDTLIGSRLVSATRARPSTTEAPEPELPDNRTANSSYLRGVRRPREVRSRGTARCWISTATRNRSEP